MRRSRHFGYPRHLTLLTSFGERLRFSRTTAYRAEEGDPDVSLRIYLSILEVLSLQEHLQELAREDWIGRIGRRVGPLPIPLARLPDQLNMRL